MTRLTVERGAELLSVSAAVLMLPDAEGLQHVCAAHGIDEERVARFRAPLTDEIVGRLQGLLDVPDEWFIAVPRVVGGVVTGLLAVATHQASTAVDESLLSAPRTRQRLRWRTHASAARSVWSWRDRLRVSEGATTAKDRALSTLAHDIRTPLGAIQG